MNLNRLIKGIFLSFFFIFLLATGIYLAGFFDWNMSQVENNSSAGLTGSLKEEKQSGQSPYRNWEISEPELNSVSAMSVESDLLDPDKILFEKNSQIKLPIASLTKLMTAVVSVENYSLTQEVSVDKKADSQEMMETDLKLGDKLSVKDLLQIMLIGSSNKSAFALSEIMGEKKFVEAMNQKAKDLKLENTFFDDPTGLSSQNISSAEDLIKLAEYILKQHFEIAEISATKEFDLPGIGNFTNTNQLLREISNSEIVAGKTGFTTDAKGCLLLVTKNHGEGDYLLYIILGSDDRFQEMKNLVDWVNKAYIF